MLLTVSAPDDFRLVVLNVGVDDDSASQTQRLTLSAKGHLEFVKDGSLKGNAMLRAKTVCKREQNEHHSKN